VALGRSSRLLRRDSEEATQAASITAALDGLRDGSGAQLLMLFSEREPMYDQLSDQVI
jgi:hypothetical protein